MAPPRKAYEGTRTVGGGAHRAVLLLAAHVLLVRLSLARSLGGAGVAAGVPGASCPLCVGERRRCAAARA